MTSNTTADGRGNPTIRDDTPVPVQPIPEITIELMPGKKWLKLTHQLGVTKYFTLAEGDQIHRVMAETCASDCDCFRRGLEDGQREGAEAGNLRARA